MSVMTVEGRVAHPRTPIRNYPDRNRQARTLRRRDLGRREARPPLRLTARGRVAAFVASFVALAALVVGAGQMVEASGASAAGEPVAVVVGAGDTLWGIAQEIAPDRDPRSVVQQIRSLNDLGTRAIVPGQSILVPVRS